MTSPFTENRILDQSILDYGTLQRRGWTTCYLTVDSEVALHEKVLALAKQLGEPMATRVGVRVCQMLRPTSTNFAKPRSLSGTYGLGEFPLHTDTAHWLTPCRYIVLACWAPGDGHRTTSLLDVKLLPMSHSERVLLCSAPIRVTNGRNSFFSTILSNRRAFVRYDTGCMTPVMADGARALRVLAMIRWSEHVEEIRWTPGLVAVIDNWRVLHGRRASDCPDSERALLRVSIR